MPGMYCVEWIFAKGMKVTVKCCGHWPTKQLGQGEGHRQTQFFPFPVNRELPYLGRNSLSEVGFLICLNKGKKAPSWKVTMRIRTVGTNSNYLILVLGGCIAF